MKAEVCEYCAGEYLDEIRATLESKNYRVEVIKCIGLCAKYACGRINVRIREKKYPRRAWTSS
ncbi:hypothetical protein [Thermococcus paralvinellae]|uniref:hypothetical protein n=1 Tax=Thermococcus paralvinellae TaxID=582419 RepID=UPI000AE0E472|nr:hypothetical protein [Thermococcus paralvinellae]